MDAEHEVEARVIAARAGAALRERVALLVVDMDLADPGRPRMADTFQAEVDLIVAQAGSGAWRDVVTGAAADVLGERAEGHPAVPLAEAMLAQSRF